jgi:hypothetical protein
MSESPPITAADLSPPATSDPGAVVELHRLGRPGARVVDTEDLLFRGLVDATDTLRLNAAWYAALRRRVVEGAAGLKRVAAAGGPGTREPTASGDWKCVCVGCGRCDLPPGRAGRKCATCRAV